MKSFIKNNWALLLILMLGFLFRFWQINHLPGGLFPDEAANGLDVNNMFHGQIQPFYERGNGREALFFYFEALSVWLFGRGVWQFHVVSAFFGLASVAAVYFLANRLFNKHVALLSSLFLAISSYPVLISRTAFRANTVPLISTLTIFFLVRFFSAEGGSASGGQDTINKTKIKNAILSGFFLGLGFYTYTSSRMMIPLVLGFLFLIFLGFRHKIKLWFWEYAKYKFIFLFSFAISFSWIAIYYITHPGTFIGRAGQVSIFNPALNGGDIVGTFFLIFKKTILAFFTAGDLNWRHNISGFPFLAPLLSPFFLLALVLTSVAVIQLLNQAWLKKIESSTIHKALIASWFWLMLVPEISTAEGIPHGLRLTGVIPPLFILCALGVYWSWQKMPNKEIFRLEKYFVSTIFISSLIVYNFLLYFGVAAQSSDYYYAFRSDLTTVSNYLNQRNLKDKTYLSLDAFSVQTVDYLTTDYGQPYVLVDPARTYEVNLKKDDQVVFTQSTLFDRIKFMKYHAQAQLVKESKNEFGELIMLVYQQP